MIMLELLNNYMNNNNLVAVSDILRYHRFSKYSLSNTFSKAIFKGYFEIAKCVMSYLDPSIKYDIMIESAENGYIEHVIYLVSFGCVDINKRDDEALRVAAENGHLNVVRYLVSVGANIHAEEEYALIYSAENGHLNVVRYLVSLGANIHIYNNRIIAFSACCNKQEMVEYLLSVGASVDDAITNGKYSFAKDEMLKYEKIYHTRKINEQTEILSY